MNRTATLTLGALALAALTTASAAEAQTYRHVRSIRPSLGETYYQASFFDTRRNRLATFSFAAPYRGALFQPGGALITDRIMPASLGTTAGLDGAEYDPATDRGLLITQDCRVHELDASTFALVAQRTLTGATTCAGIALGADGSLYVASYGTREVVVYPRAGTAPTRRFSVAGVGTGLIDNLARVPGTDTFLVGTNAGPMALVDPTGRVLTGPAAVGVAAPLVGGMPVNADGATGIGTNGQLFFCDHPSAPPAGGSQCHFYARECRVAGDCIALTPTCVLPAGATVGTCAVCASNADCTAAGLGVCDDTLRVCVPAAPVVSSPMNASVVTSARPVIRGTAPPNSTVVVYLDGAEAGRATADATGAWSFTPAADLAAGSHSVYAQTLVGGRLSLSSNTNTFRVGRCASDADCSGATPRCDLATAGCVAGPATDAAVTLDAAADAARDASPADVARTDVARTDVVAADVVDATAAADAGLDPTIQLAGDGACACSAPGTRAPARAPFALAGLALALRLTRRRTRR